MTLIKSFKNWLKLRYTWYKFHKPSLELWDAIFANWDDNPSWKSTPYPTSFKEWFFYGFVVDDNTRSGKIIKAIRRLWNPYYIEIVPFVCEPRTINVKWTRQAEVEMKTYFNLDINKALCKLST